MGKSRVGAVVDTYLEEAMSSQEFGNSLLRAQGVDPRRLLDVAPMDDGQPPGPPTGLYTLGFLQSIDVGWDDQPSGDYVDHTVVEVTSPTNVVTLHESSANTTTVNLTELGEHSVRAKHVDVFGRESVWSSAVVGNPRESADYLIDMAKAEALGNLANLIPSINTELLSGENFAENTLKAISMAQPDSSNMLPLIEVDFERWAAGIAWSPADTNKAEVKYITHLAPVGNSATVVDRSGMKWLAFNRTSALDDWYVPFSLFKQYGTFVGESYIWSAFVDGTAGHNVRLSVQAASDAAGTGVIEVGSKLHTLDASSGGERIYFKFTVPSGKPYVRVMLKNLNNNSVTYWTRFQLERAGNKLEPSAWTAGVFTTGSIGANMISAIDLTAANAIFKNLSIDTAAIKNLTVDKLATGTLLATTINLSSTGYILAGATKFDSEGISLPTDNVFSRAPSDPNLDYRITNTGTKFASMHFYDLTSSDHRGIVMRADGNGTSRRGQIVFDTSYGGNMNTENAAYLNIRSGNSNASNDGIIVVKPKLWVVGDLDVDGKISSQPYGDTDSIPTGPGQTMTWTHGFGFTPTLVAAYLTDNNRRMLPTSPTTSGIDIYVSVVNSTHIKIENKSGSTFDIKAYAWR